MIDAGFADLPRNEQIYYLCLWGVVYSEIAYIFDISITRVSKIAVDMGYRRPHTERRK